MIAAGAVSYHFAKEGNMNLREGETSSVVEVLPEQTGPVYNPATGSVIARVPRGGAAEVDRAAAAAKAVSACTLPIVPVTLKIVAARLCPAPSSPNARSAGTRRIDINL